MEINQCVGCISHFSAMARPSWLGRAARNEHRHAIEQASRRWRGGGRDDSARTRRKILISTQVHWVGEDYKAQDYVNPVDGDEVPVPHFGLQMPTYELWKDVVDRVKAAGIPFIIEPTLRFEGAPGEQWTCFFKDPSGNNLEFKHMSKPQNLFAKYNVAEG